MYYLNLIMQIVSFKSYLTGFVCYISTYLGTISLNNVDAPFSNLQTSQTPMLLQIVLQVLRPILLAQLLVRLSAIERSTVD